MRKTRTIYLILSISFLFPALGWASEMSAMWTNLYRNSEGLERQFSIMGQMIQEDDRDLIPLFIEAQEQLLQGSKDSMTVSEQFYHTDLQKMIIRELGEVKSAEGGEVVYQTITESLDIFLKSDAIRTLGMMGAVEYVVEVATILRNINMGSTIIPNKEERETLVLACISCLERMKQPEGFEAVFFAATGRYSRGVVQAAENSLSNMIEDPSVPLIRIITGSDDFGLKLKALNFAAASSAPEESLARVGASSLVEGLRYNADDLRQKITLAGLRTVSCGLLIKYGYTDPEISRNLNRMLLFVPKETGDLNEILTCIQALGAGNNEESVQILITHLKKLNDLQSEGITLTDQREIKTVIQALGNTGNPAARAELTRVQFSDWNSAVNRESRAALENLN